MIGRLALSVFVAGIFSLVRVMGIIDQFSLMHNFKRLPNRPVSQAADGAGNQQLLAGRQNAFTFGRIADRSQGNGQQLVGPQAIICRCILCRGFSSGVQAVRQVLAVFQPVARQDGTLNLLGQCLPICFGLRRVYF